MKPLVCALAVGLSVSKLLLASTMTAQVLDLNQDTVPDFVGINAESHAVEVRATASGEVLASWAYTQADVSLAAVSLLPDLTGDGTPEILVHSQSAAFLEVADPVNVTRLWRQSISAVQTLFVEDQDSDGFADILAEQGGTPVETALLSGASGRVLTSRVGTAAQHAAAIAQGGRIFSVADLNDDGLIAGNDLSIFLNGLAAGESIADINADGVSNDDDLFQFLAAFESPEFLVPASQFAASGNSGNTGGGQGGDADGATAECGCPNEQQGGHCHGGTVTVSCPDAAAWPSDGSAMPVVVSWNLPFGATNIRYTCFEVCRGAANGQQGGGIVTSAMSAIAAGERFRVHTETIYVNPAAGANRIEVCVSYDMVDPVTGDISRCSACGHCDKRCHEFFSQNDFDVICPRYALPGRSATVSAVTPGTNSEAFCSEWLWVIFEGHEHVVSPQFEPFLGDSGMYGGGTHYYRGGSTIVLQFADAAVAPGARVTIGAMCMNAFRCIPTWSGDGCTILISGDRDGDGLADEREIDMADGGRCPNPDIPDSDRDGFDDGIDPDACDPLNIPAVLIDSDNDGMSNVEESAVRFTDPLVFDCDEDGLQDYAEVVLGLNPLSPFSTSGRGGPPDGDLEIAKETDRDRDGLFDDYERQRGLDPANADQDGDGVRDGLEVRNGMSPVVPDQGLAAPLPQIDSDGDGLSNYVEGRLRTNPGHPDSDRDGVSDGQEARLGTNPKLRHTRCTACGPADGDADWDGDGLANAFEERVGLDPGRRDTDDDGVCDKEDMADGNEAAEQCRARGCTPAGGVQGCDFGVDRCYVMRLEGLAGDFVWVNGEKVNVVNGVAMVAVAPGDRLVIGIPCDAFGGTPHGLPQVGSACRNADGGFDSSTYQQDANASQRVEESYEKSDSYCGQGTNGNGGSAAGNHGGEIGQTQEVEIPELGCGNDQSTEPGDCTGESRYLDLWIDTNNDASRKVQGRNAADDGLEPDLVNQDPSTIQSGKILFANTKDADGDNIPDFADGYGWRPESGAGAGLPNTPPDRQSLFSSCKGNTSTVPVVVRLNTQGLAALGDWSIRFDYSASPPSKVARDAAGNFHPAPGAARLWMQSYRPRQAPAQGRANIRPGAGMGRVHSPFPGIVVGHGSADMRRDSESQSCSNEDATRNGEAIDPEGRNGGSFVPSGVPISLSAFLQSGSSEIKLELEAVKASVVKGELRVRATLVPPAGGQQPNCVRTAPALLTDVVQATAIDWDVVRINPATGALGAVVRTHELPQSNPAPVITINESTIISVSIDPQDPTRLLASLRVRADVTDQASNLIPASASFDFDGNSTVENVNITKAGVAIGDESVGVGGTAGLTILQYLDIPIITVEKLQGPPDNATAFQRRIEPYRWKGEIDHTFDVPVHPTEENFVTIFTTNYLGVTGSTKIAFRVGWTPPSPIQATYRLELNNWDPASPGNAWPAGSYVFDDGYGPGIERIARLTYTFSHNSPVASAAHVAGTVLTPRSDSRWNGLVAGVMWEFDRPGGAQNPAPDTLLDPATIERFSFIPNPSQITPVPGLPDIIWEDNAQLTFVESDVDTRVFDAVDTLPVLSADMRLWWPRATIQQPGPAISAGPGVFAPLTVRVRGPANVLGLGWVRSLKLGANEEPLLIASDFSDAEIGVLQTAAGLDAVWLAIRHPVPKPGEMDGPIPTPTRQREHPIKLPIDAAKDSDWRDPAKAAKLFAQGFGTGVYDWGAGVVDDAFSIVGLARSAANGTWKYAKLCGRYMFLADTEIFVEIGNDGERVIAKAEVVLKTASQISEVLEDGAAAVVIDPVMFYEAAIEGDEGSMTGLSVYGPGALITAQLTSALHEELKELSPRDAGWIAGQISAEVTSTVVSAGVLKGAQLTFRGMRTVREAADLADKLASPGGKVREVFIACKVDDQRLINRVSAKLVDAMSRIQGLHVTRICFVAGTLVWTADGLKPIEEVKTGEWVWSLGEGMFADVGRDVDYSRSLQLVQVLATPRSFASHLIHVEFEADSGDRETIVGTAEHPVFVVGRGMERHGGKFVPLGEVDVGDEVVLASGTFATVSRVVRQQVCDGDEFGFAQTYNLDVGDTNTYFVGRGGLWVHNVGDEKCKALYALTHNLLAATGRLDTRASREAIFRHLFGTPGLAALSKEQKKRLFIETQDAIYKKAIGPTGVVDLRTTMSYDELDGLRRHLGLVTSTDEGDPLAAHHGAFWAHMRDLLKAQPGGRTDYVKGKDPLLDGVPGLLGPNDIPMPSVLIETGRHTGTGGFHSIFNSRMRTALAGTGSNSFEGLCAANRDQAKIVLRRVLTESYQEMETLYGAVDNVSYISMGKLSVGWIDYILP